MVRTVMGYYFYRHRGAIVVFAVFAALLTTENVSAIFKSISPEIDVEELPDSSLIHSRNDQHDYLRFLAFEHHLGFVGGRNNMMVLNMTASLEQRRMIARDLSFPEMNETQLGCFELFSEDSIESELLCRSTYVRALLRRQTDDSVVFCGIGAFEPRCWLCKDAAKKLLHKSGDLYDFQPKSYHFEQINNGKDIVPFEPDSNFTSFLSDGKIFSGIYETPEVNSAIFQPVIVARPLTDLDVNASQDTLLTRTVIAESASLSRPHFVGSLDGGDFGYMFFNEQKSAKIAQFCKNGPTAVGTTGSTVSASFFKAFLFCGFLTQPKMPGGSGITSLNVESLFSSSSPPVRFEQLADVTPLSPAETSASNRFFYGAFNRDPDVPSSIGICLFEESAIRKLFAKSPFVRLTSTAGVIKPVLPVAYGTEDLTSRPNNCSATFSEAEALKLHNFRVKYTNIYRLATMVNSEPVFFDTTVNYRLTTIAVDWNPNLDRPGWQHLLFVGTSSGRLLRISVDLVEQDLTTVTSRSNLLRNGAMRTASFPPDYRGGPFDVADFSDPFVPKITTRLLSRVKFFSESSPIMRLSAWPPSYNGIIIHPKRRTSVTALLVIGKTSVGLHFIRSGEETYATSSTFCNCLAEGYPYFVPSFNRQSCEIASDFMATNETIPCPDYRIHKYNNIPAVAAVITPENGRENNGDPNNKRAGAPFSESPSNSTVITTIIACIFVLIIVIVLIAIFVWFRKRKRKAQKIIAKPFEIRQKLAADDFPAVIKTDLLDGNGIMQSIKVTVATEMTPTNSPKQKLRTLPRQIIGAKQNNYVLTQFGTLSRHGSKLSGRNNLMYSAIPTSRSLPDQLNEDVDSKYNTDEDEDFVASPAGETQLSRLSPSSGTSSENKNNSSNINNNEDPLNKTPGSLPTPTTLNQLVLSLPPNGQPHNRIMQLPPVKSLKKS